MRLVIQIIEVGRLVLVLSKHGMLVEILRSYLIIVVTTLLCSCFFASMEELGWHGLSPAQLLLTWLALVVCIPSTICLTARIGLLLVLLTFDSELVRHTIIDHSCWQLQVLGLVLLLLSGAIVHIQHLLVNVVCVVIVVRQFKRIGCLYEQIRSRHVHSPFVQIKSILLVILNLILQHFAALVVGDFIFVVINLIRMERGPLGWLCGH